MRTLIESTFVSLDGVVSDPHVWGQPSWDAEHDAYNSRLRQRAGVLLLGRETFEDRTLLDHGLLDGVLGAPTHLRVAERSGFDSGITVLTLVPRDAT